MRIAELSTRYPPGPGGVERHVGEITRRLAKGGDEVGVFTSDLYREFPWQRLDPKVPRRETHHGVEVRRIPVWTLPSELHYPFFRGLGRELEEFRPDVLHAHTYGTHHATVAARHHRRTGAPLVLTAHFHPIWSIEGGWFRHRLRGFYDRSLAGRVLKDVARLVVQTHEEERLMQTLGIPLPPTEIIPPGYVRAVAPLDDPFAFRTAFHLTGPFLLFVGRLASNKGLLDLLEAFAPLAQREPGLSLVLVGEDGGMRPAVEARLRAAGLERRVVLTGHLRDERLLASAYRESSFLVLPSEYEAFGLVLLEALAQGTPVLASRVGGIPEVLDGGSAGYLVPPRAPKELAAALELFYHDPELRRRLATYGREKVVPRYDWDRVTSQLRALFERVVAA